MKMTVLVRNKFEKCVTLKIQMFLDKTLSCWVSSSCCKGLQCLHLQCQAVFFLNWLSVKALQVSESLAVTQWTTHSHIQKHLSPIPFWEPQIWQCIRLQLKCDGTRRRTRGEVKGKLANGAGSQYSSHHLRTRCIQHYYCWCAQLSCQ
jgi:hypothetical protein